MPIRKAEARYVPIHLRTAMEKTGYWGAVRVVPEEREGYELLVRGTIVFSDGEVIVLRVNALDAAGTLWFDRTYRGKATVEDYRSLSPGEDGFEPVYRTIANDLARFRKKLTAEESTRIRRIASMRFAIDMAPGAFTSHITRNEFGQYTLLRLPAEDDPSFARVNLIRERDFLLIDTLNGHYENYYRELQLPYEEWRKARSIEIEALREVERSANTQKALGVAAILAAIAIEVTGSPSTRAQTGTIRDVLVLGGAYSIKRGMDISSQRTLHEEEITELGNSFSAESEPLIVEVDGEVHKLTGSAETQYEQWRALLKKIYASETGLPPESDVGAGSADVSGDPAMETAPFDTDQVDIQE